MDDYFFSLVDKLCDCLDGDEVLLSNYYGENSDFVRLNRGLVRQAGNVLQREIHLELIRGKQHSGIGLQLSGHGEQDMEMCKDGLATIRQRCQMLPADPFLSYSTDIQNTDHRHTNAIPESAEAVDLVLGICNDRKMDLVGILANGTTSSGFANSLGQKNWHTSASLNVDWSCYLETDKAVKTNYSKLEWDKEQFQKTVQTSQQHLESLALPPKSLQPGEYRAYLSPNAVREIVDMMSWGGFGLKSHRTAQTPLLKMVKDGAGLDPQIHLKEDCTGGIAPVFTPFGYVFTDPVELINDGAYKDCLISPRSAQEYECIPNSGGEMPNTLQMGAGQLGQKDILAELDTGLYINNLWYCNFSDRNECRITGMTRFACFWVEQGVIQGPLNVMRFDDSIYRMFGEKLLGLSQERELIFDADTYHRRSDRSYLLPGALLSKFKLTL